MSLINKKNSSEGGKVSATGSPPTAVSCAEGVDDIGRTRGRTALLFWGQAAVPSKWGNALGEHSLAAIIKT